MPGRTFNSNQYRYGYSNHEKIDEISGSGNQVDMGGRYLDTRLGRTSSIDPESYAYSSISPYAFAMNSPNILFDPDGKRVKALSKEAEQVIRLGLSPEESRYLRFDRFGNIKQRSLKRGMRKLVNVGDNYRALLSLVKEEEVYEVEIASTFAVHSEIKDNKGSISFIDMGEVTYSSVAEDTWNYYEKDNYEKNGKTKEDYLKDHPEYSTVIVPAGFRGVSLYADEFGGYGYSASGTNRVIVNPNQTLDGQVETLAHELYGHEYFKSQGKPHSHGGWSPEDPGWNYPLEDQIKSREKEATENYKKHQK